VQELARQSLIIEKHYGRPMDIEWAKDGNTGKLYIVQARPETVKSRAHATQLERFHLGEAARCSPKAARSARRSAPARRA
jgi:pyruvate,water dikinase